MLPAPQRQLKLFRFPIFDAIQRLVLYGSFSIFWTASEGWVCRHCTQVLAPAEFMEEPAPSLAPLSGFFIQSMFQHGPGLLPKLGKAILFVLSGRRSRDIYAFENLADLHE